MLKYKKLLNYIPYFEDETTVFTTWINPNKNTDGMLLMGYPKYDEKFKQFINDIYETDLLHPDYLEMIRKIDNEEIIGSIKTADFNSLRSILTFYVRQERFCDGMWAIAIEEKIFLTILYRLREVE
jgi:hypothetical protein